MTDKLKLYHIDDNYTTYLKQFESHIWNNSGKGTQRPYVGTVIEINSYKYFAPLTSPKQNNAHWKETLTTIRLLDSTTLLGFICLHNMIPVKIENISLVDLNTITDIRYRNFVIKEIVAIRKKSDKIRKSALNLYNEITNPIITKPYILKIKPHCFKFKELEQHCDSYNR